MNQDPKRIDYSKKFLKQLKKAPLKIQIAFRDRFAIFLADPFDPILDNHSLTGNYLGKRSINITGDWRAIYSETTDEAGDTGLEVYLLGTHSQLYG